MQISGQCDDRFSAAKRAVEKNFATQDEIGACGAITHEGECVVDLWVCWRSVSACQF